MEAINHQIIDQIIQRIDLGSDRQLFFNQQPYGYTQGQPVSVQMLAENLQNLIYSEFYIKPTQKSEQIPTTQEVQNFTNTLQKANQTKERFDEGWTVISVDYQGIILAQKGSYKRNVQAGEYIGESCFGRKPQQEIGRAHV